MKTKAYARVIALLLLTSPLFAQTVSYTDCYLNSPGAHAVSFVPTGRDADGRTIYASSGDDGTGLYYLLMYCKTIATGGGTLVEGWGIYPYEPHLGVPNCGSSVVFYNTTQSLTPPPVGLGTWRLPPGSVNSCPENDLVLTVPPILTTSVAGITYTSANLSGSILSVGNTNPAYGSSPAATITDRGIVYGTTAYPSLVDGIKISNGTGNGGIATTVTNLNPGTTYYARAYATTSIGTGYGGNVQFTTTTITPTNGIVYVKKGGNGNGSSWANAAPELGYALRWAHQKRNDNAIAWQANPLQIWVAGGTYKPMFSPADANFGVNDGRNNAFLLVKNVKLYGGFAGTETSLSQRNLELAGNKTILSGDINDDDALSRMDPPPTLANTAENTYHVLVSAGDVGGAEIHGFTVTGGNANGSGALIVNANEVSKQEGGGISSRQSAPKISNCFFTGNSATLGGGMSSQSGNANVYNCVFTENFADTGGGIYSASSQVTVVNSTVVGNVAPSGSGVFGTNDVNTLHKVYNGILWDAIGGEFDFKSSLIKGRDNSLEGNLSAAEFTASNLFTDINHPTGPDGIYGTSDDGLSVRICSPTINAGNSARTTDGDVDITGTPRIRGRAVDLGAYEYHGDTNGNPGGEDLLALSSDESYIDVSEEGSYQMHSATDECRLLASLFVGPTSALRGGLEAKVFIDPSVQLHQGSPYVPRHYLLTPEQETLSATARVTLYYTQNDFSRFNEVQTTGSLPTAATDHAGKTNLRVYQYHGNPTGGNTPASYSGKMTAITPAEDDIVWNEEKERWEITFLIDGFSGFFIGSVQAPLPVTLADMDVQEIEEAARLTWRTTSEVNASHFEIERSTDAKSFRTIGNVLAVGNQSSTPTYTFLDKGFKTLSERAYYRLKMVDRDATSSYSKIVSLHRSTPPLRRTLYPNPVNRNSTFVFESEFPVTHITLTDQFGRPLPFQIEHIRGNQYKIKIGPLVDRGLYRLSTSAEQHLLVVQ
jgi:hypothetical protein